MAGIPRYRPVRGPALFSAGFRPFFLASAIWAAVGIPLWLAWFGTATALPTALPPLAWHVHEMIFGYVAATIAGFLLTAIPNWTGRMPLQGVPLAALIVLWAAGRLGVLFSQQIGAPAAAALDLAFPAAFLAVIAREILAGRNWRNLPMVGALALLLIGNLLVHLEALGVAATAASGNRLGIATALMLVSLVGGRILPSFTRNWLAKQAPSVAAPAGFDLIDRAALGLTAFALLLFVVRPTAAFAGAVELIAGIAIAVRLIRWRGVATLREPLVWVLHLGYFWLALGFVLLGLDTIFLFWPQTAALHALTVGAIGTMTLAVMTRASLGHTGRPLSAGVGTTAIYALITLAAVLRIVAPLGGGGYLMLLEAAGAAWSGAFGLFAVLYARPLMLPRVRGEARAI